MFTPLETIYLFGFVVTILIFVAAYDRINTKPILATKIIMEGMMVFFAVVWPVFWGVIVIRGFKRG